MPFIAVNVVICGRNYRLRMKIRLSVMRYCILMLLLGGLYHIPMSGQDVEPDVLELHSLPGDTLRHYFSSFATPFINGPSATEFGDYIYLNHLGGYDYELVSIAGNAILPQGWTSHYQFTPDSLSSTYSVQRLRMYVEESILSLHNDFFRADMDSSILLDVLANDQSTNGAIHLDAVTISNNADASVVDSIDMLRFTPHEGFEGMARLQYVACDSLENCSIANVSIYVYNPMDSVSNDTVMATSINSREIQIPLPYSGFEFLLIPANGEAYIDTANILHYTADEGFSGQDTMTVWDSLDYYHTVIVDALVVAQENGFVIQDVFYLTPAASYSFDVYQNDFYNTLSIDTFTQVDTGLLVLDSLGSFTYTPPDDFIGYTTFSYTVCNGDVCETTSVYLFVGKQEPRSDIDNHYTTARHLPVIIDFDNDLDKSDWEITIVDPARYGNASIPIFYFDPCVTFNILTDYLIYEPGNHIGDDTFSISYCLIEPNICDTIDIFITVEDDPTASCSCTERCVWPGDANNDGMVDMSDLLEIGLRIGELGLTRSADEPTSWEAQYARNWDLSNGDPLDAKYADTNGDGIISALDTVSIVDNYHQIHALVANRDHLMETIPIELTDVEGPLDSGDLVVMDVLLGSHDVPALDVHGMSFSLEYDSELVDSSSVKVDFMDYAWLIGESPKFDLDISDETGIIDAGVTRLDRAVASGYGIVAQFSFIIIDDVEGIRPGDKTRVPLTIKMKNISLKSSDGLSRVLPDIERTIYISRDGVQAPVTDKQLYVFPNPATTQITVHLNGKNTMQAYQFFDFSGKQHAQGTVTGKRDQIDVSALSSGLYILRVMTAQGPVVKKVQIEP